MKINDSYRLLISNTMEIRKAYLSEKNEIIDFIRELWKKDHIFVKDNKFFDYEMCSFDELQFIVAKSDSDELAGILGYIQYNSDITIADSDSPK